MTIKLPVRRGEPLERTLEVGGGAAFRYGTSFYTTSGQIMELNESQGHVRVKGTDFDVWIHKDQISEYFAPEQYSQFLFLEERDR